MTTQRGGFRATPLARPGRTPGPQHFHSPDPAHPHPQAPAHSHSPDPAHPHPQAPAATRTGLDSTRAGTGRVWPQLLPGTELVGRSKGSGLRHATYLVRRCDGQVVQLSELLYTIARYMDGRGPAAIAERVSADTDLRITREQVEYVAEQKLQPLGVIAGRDGAVVPLARKSVLMGLRYRARIVPERAVAAIAGPLRVLFVPPIVVLALATLAACDVWLGTGHGVGAGMRTILRHPALGLGLFGLIILSLAIHECGHAAACRYGGARPGAIGVGLYLVWPVFYTDVTDSWRLSRSARLRVDLGGVYFNVLVALAAAGAGIVTGYRPLFVVVVSQQLLILDQFLPWVRLDGYHVVSDLVGVPDLFGRIGPVVGSMLYRRVNPRVNELKRWARAAVTVWVISTLLVLVGVLVAVVLGAPVYLEAAWRSLLVELGHLRAGVRAGNVVEVVSCALGAVMLVLPLAAITLTYLGGCSRLGSSLAARSARRPIAGAQARGSTPVRPHRAGQTVASHPGTSSATRTMREAGAAQQAGPASKPAPSVGAPRSSVTTAS